MLQWGQSVMAEYFVEIPESRLLDRYQNLHQGNGQSTMAVLYKALDRPTHSITLPLLARLFARAP